MYKIIGADQKEYGPVTTDQLRQWIAEGRVNAQTLIQAEGQTGWQPLSAFPELAPGLPPSPITPPPAFGAAPAANAVDRVRAPATALLVVGILLVVLALLSIVMNLAGFRQTPKFGNPQIDQYIQAMSGTPGTVMALVEVLIGGLVVFAALKFKRLESYGLVVAGTVLSMLPCTSSCCCIGLPIGIWILVVLMKPEVKSAFH